MKTRALYLIALLALLAGCATTPIGVTRVSPQEAHRSMMANALSAGTPSQ